ncbi:uncharacterized protein LOC127262519 [Andrographis paniculata]|uniref:uncharacterized protein LOC127262519 n=1 Tax=Andrographis paniculata TaxID=175694 RepID=UPI0021E7FF47|nr:uncharacterized protein LOC127262519 [Andrographis paniculata]
MAGNSGRQKKQSSFSLFGMFRGGRNRGSKGGRRSIEEEQEYSVKAYKVYPSDEDRGRWVAEPGIDNKASAYITHTTHKWENIYDT